MALFPQLFSGSNPRASPAANEPDSRARSVLGWIRDVFTGYVGPDLSRGTPIQDQISSEKAKAGPAEILLPWFLPYYDDITGETALIRSYYRKMLADPNVKAAVLDKLFAVASLSFQVQPDGEGPKAKRVADFVKFNLQRRLKGGIRKLVESLAWGALVDGYSVSEKVWKLEQKGAWAGKYVLSALKSKDVGNDIALLTDEYRNIVGLQGLRYNPGTVFSPANFVIVSHLSLYETPTGMSDFRAVYSRWWLLDTSWKLRAMGLEKRAFPILLAHYQRSQDKPSLEAALTQAKLAGWITAPPGTQIQAVETAGRSQDEFDNAIRALKHEIFLGIAGAILQALEGNTTDGRGNSLVHRDTASLFKWYVSQLVTDAVNDHESGLVPDMVDLNFSGAGYPLVTLDAVDADQLKGELELDKGLHDMGIDLSKKEVYGRYSRTPPTDDADKLPGAPPQAAKPGGGADAGIGSLSEAGSEVPAQPFRFSDGWRNYLCANQTAAR